MTNSKVSRRQFIKTAAVAAGASAFPLIVPARLFGADTPSKTVTFGFVGVGGMGMGNIGRVLGLSGAKILAVCDVDKYHTESAARTINKKYGNDDCAMYGDFRELTARKDIDAVVISTPDHWHILPAMDAMRHGKDVYVEKPLTLTIAEGIAYVKEVRRLKRVAQTGTQQRSDDKFRLAAECIRNGRIGKVSEIDVLIPANNKFCGATWSPEPVPEAFDYDFWLGQAPWAPFTRQRCHYNFRFVLDYSGGQVTNWGTHYLDIAQWALGMDESGPVAVEGRGEFPTSGLFTTATYVDFTCTYANGVQMRCHTRTDGVFDGTVKFIGDDGWILVSRSSLKASNPDMLKETFGANEVRLTVSKNHMGNFHDCIIDRERPVSEAETGHRTASICHLGNIAMLLARKLKWDPAKEEFIGDEMANRMRARAMRSPWSLA